MASTRESFRQQQESEFEVIQSIFGSDVKDLREKRTSSHWKPLDLVITLLPQKGSSLNRQIYAKTNLRIICPYKYPKVSPKISLEETKGLSDVQKNELLEELNSICTQKKGEVVIYDLTQAIGAFLHKHNKEPAGSFYDQMLIEHNERVNERMMEQAERLNKNQQVLQDQLLKQKFILRSENNLMRENRRTMSESSPKHRASSSTELEDSIGDRMYPNKCELHMSSEELYFAVIGKKVLRGCCLGHSQNGSITYSGTDINTGQLYHITEWNLKHSQLEKKCPIDCKKGQSCGGHGIDTIINSIEKEIIKLSGVRHKNLVTVEAVTCLRRKEGLIVYVLQEFVLGTSVNNISNSLGWTYAGVSIMAKGVLDALIYLHNCGISHSNLDDCAVFMDNLGMCRVSDFSLTPYMCYLFGAPVDKEDDIPALGSLIESLVPLPNTDMLDFIEQCKSERTLSASDLMEHPFLLPERARVHNDSLQIAMPEKKVNELAPLMVVSSGVSRLETEFEVINWLGQGAYGDVLKVKNILDNRQYAIKRIPLTSRSRQLFKKMTREVELLLRLNHENIVRYFNSWIEWTNQSNLNKYTSSELDDDSLSTSQNASLSIVSSNGDASSLWLDAARNNARNFSSDGIVFANSDGEDDDDDDDDDEDEEEEEDIVSVQPSTSTQQSLNPSMGNKLQVMYIQMEFCEKSTLRSAIDSNLHKDPARVWRLFREIAEGLAHIHSQGMIHRDLKPVNIFLDLRDQVKIGDFGLATTSFLALQQSREVNLSSNRADHISSSHTGNVGTALYVAPELMGKAAKSTYNQKVDLYSLGIIFFEMCHRPFKTGMERIETLAAIRLPKIVLPQCFETNKEFENQVKVIRWLLDHDQTVRPTTEVLLSSDLLPPAPLEDSELQEMLRHVLANPQSKTYKSLVARSLNQPSDTMLELTYHLGFVQINRRLEYVKRKITSLFRTHGAVECVTPLLSPYMSATKHNAVRLMTHSGSVVTLPYDLRIPFIKQVALSGVNLLRRYSVGRVYREKKFFNCHPKQLYECAFDIITPTSTTDGRNRLIDAELISIGYELTKILPALHKSNLSIRLNHTHILQAILINHNVPVNKYNEIFAATVDYIYHRLSKFQLHAKLQFSLGISKHATTNLMDALITEIPLGGPRNFYEIGGGLRNIMKGHSEASKMARVAMEEVENVVSLAQSFGVMCPISLCAGLPVGFEHARNGGIIWQLVGNFKANSKKVQTNILAVGGRYDYTLSEFQKQAVNRGVQIPNKNINGAGLSLSLDKILIACQETDSETIDVVVCICGKPKFHRDVSQILRSLWAAGIRCAVFQTNNSEDGQDIAKDLCATYFVLYTEDGILRIRSWINDKFEERLLNRDEIIAYIMRGARPESLNDSNNVLQPINQYNDNTNKYGKTNVTMTKSALPALDIKFSTLEKLTTGSRKRLENILTNQVSKSLLLFNKREQIVIIVVDLQPAVVRAIIGAIDPPGSSTKEIAIELSSVIDRFPDNRRYIKDIIEEIQDVYANKERSSIVCLYCLKDSYYRFIL